MTRLRISTSFILKVGTAFRLPNRLLTGRYYNGRLACARSYPRSCARESDAILKPPRFPGFFIFGPGGERAGAASSTFFVKATGSARGDEDARGFAFSQATGEAYRGQQFVVPAPFVTTEVAYAPPPRSPSCDGYPRGRQQLAFDAKSDRGFQPAICRSASARWLSIIAGSWGL